MAEYLNIRANIKGIISIGNTLDRMFENSVINVTPSIEFIKGKSRGTTIAATTFDSIVYVNNAPVLPPSYL